MNCRKILEIGRSKKSQKEIRKEKQEMPNPFELEIEEDISNFDIVNAKATLFEVGGVSPTTIIRTNQDWRVQFEWKVDGSLNHIMAGNWILEVLLEKMGGGEFDLANNTKNVPFVSEPHVYNGFIEFPADSVAKGKYKIIAAITFEGPTGHPGPIALTGEGPLVTFFETV